jgi:hypothetical protein
MLGFKNILNLPENKAQSINILPGNEKCNMQKVNMKD